MKQLWQNLPQEFPFLSAQFQTQTFTKNIALHPDNIFDTVVFISLQVYVLETSWFNSVRKWKLQGLEDFVFMDKLISFLPLSLPPQSLSLFLFLSLRQGFSV